MRVEKIGLATLYLGDCREILPGLERVDAVITDPPYGIGFKYSGYEDTPENLIELIETAIKPAISLAKRTIITPGNTNIHAYPKPSWMGAWTWDTTTARGFWGWSQWQPILLYGEDSCTGFVRVNGVMRCDRIHFSGGEAKIVKAEGGGHTCPKPLRFMEKLILRFTNSGEMILDPFLGSGTSGVAAVRLARSFIGIEIEERYFDVACRRIEEAQRQGDMFRDAVA